MAGSINGRDQSTDDPKSNFAVPGVSQFPQSSYPFPIDSELTMPSNYPVPQYAQQLEDTTQTIDTASHGPLSNPHVKHTGTSPSASTTDPAITMSQPPHQTPASFPAGGLRASGDDSPEQAQASQTGDKRKRSKTSRACDECRRKKVRCDAPTEADGTPKTCSNCQKAGVPCEFERKPMKRGPSRGYIRELSERVEQVELVQKQALRQSFDAGAAFVQYGDTILPDPGSSATKPTLSFNDQRPFAPSEFQRDRIPSSGNWGPPSSTTSLRLRERGSIGIAPDQALAAAPTESETSQAYETVDPDWPPPKRRRLESSVDFEPFKMDRTFLNKFYMQVQPLFPLLPDVDTVLEVVAQAPEFSHAFGVAIELFPYVDDEVTVNGNHDSSPSNVNSETPGNPVKRTLTSPLFRKYNDLAAYLAEQMKEEPSLRTEDENLACLWTCLVLALEGENDVRTIEKEPMSKSHLLHYSLRTLAHLRSGPATASEDDTIKDRAQFKMIVKQAHNCACVLTKYHSLSIGIGYLDLAPADELLQISQIESLQDVTPEAAFIIESSETVGHALSMLPTTVSDGGHLANFFTKVLVKPGVGRVLDRFPQLDEQNPIVQQVVHFVDSLAVRIYRRILHLDIMKASAGMSDALLSDAKNRRFNPLDIHVSALLVVTLCEIVNSCNNAGLCEIANIYLNQAQVLLQKKSDAFHKGYGFEWFYAPTLPGENEPADQYQSNHWTDCLLRMIHWVQSKPPAVEKTQDLVGLVLPDLKKTARVGWLNILSRFQG